MKKVNFLLMILVIFITTSCFDDNNDNNATTSYVDNVSIITQQDSSCYFIGSSGEIFIPEVRYTNKKNIKTAFIQFYVSKDLSSSSEKKYVIKLILGPICIDAAVNNANSELELNSLKDDSILTFKVYRILNKRYLITGVNYMMANKLHCSTLCYITEKGFAKSTKSNEPDTMKFILRNDAKNDVPSDISSYYLYVNDKRPDLFFKSYDIKNILDSTFAKTTKSNIYIDIVSKTYETGSKTCRMKHDGITYSRWNCD